MYKYRLINKSKNVVPVTKFRTYDKVALRPGEVLELGELTFDAIQAYRCLERVGVKLDYSSVQETVAEKGEPAGSPDSVTEEPTKVEGSVEESAEASVEDFSSYSKAQLIALAQERGVILDKTMTKSAMIEALTNA